MKPEVRVGVELRIGLRFSVRVRVGVELRIVLRFSVRVRVGVRVSSPSP